MSDDLPCIRITIEVPIHKHYPNYYANEQIELLNSAVAAAVSALHAAAAAAENNP